MDESCSLGPYRTVERFVLDSRLFVGARLGFAGLARAFATCSRPGGLGWQLDGLGCFFQFEYAHKISISYKLVNFCW